MQKPRFFQCETASDARAETPPGGAINAPCGHQMLLFAMNQLHSPTEKKTAQKSDKNEKQFCKKWNLHPSAAIRAPSSASLKKGCLEHSKNAGFYKVSTTLQRETRCAWICSKLLRFCKVFLMKKKVEKSEIEQNICVLLFRMEKRVTEPQFLSQMILGHQITTTKGYTCALMVLQTQNEG